MKKAVKVIMSLVVALSIMLVPQYGCAKTKEEIDASEIEISIPKKGEAEEVLPLNGRIEHFNVSRGYGFIKDLGSGEKYFFHVTSAPEGITEGDNVTFEIERGTRGMNAVRISIINK